MMPWIALATVSTIAAAALAGMGDWTPEQWTVFIGAVVAGAAGTIGAITKGTIKVLAALKKIETAAQASVPPEQLEAMVRKVVTEVLAAQKAAPRD